MTIDVTKFYPAGVRLEHIKARQALHMQVKELDNTFLKKIRNVEGTSEHYISNQIGNPELRKNLLLKDLKKASSGQGNYMLSSKTHASAELKANDQRYTRSSSSNKLPVFYFATDTEQPSKASIKLLSDDDKKWYEPLQFLRYIGKRGRDFITGKPIGDDDGKTGTSSLSLSMQNQSQRNIRGAAATATIDCYTTHDPKNNCISELHKSVIEQLKQNDPEFLKNGGPIHLVRPGRDPYAKDALLNFNTLAIQTEVAASLNAYEVAAAKSDERPPIKFTNHKSLITLSRTERIDASPIVRLAQQPRFTTDEIAPGDKVIIVDDHIQAGGTIHAMAAALEGKADVYGVAALTVHPYCRNLVLDKQVEDHMSMVLNKLDPEGKILDMLNKVGLPAESLTNTEAMIVIAYATNPDNIEDINKFRELDKHLMQGVTVMEGANDSLEPILEQMPKSPEEIIAELKKTASDMQKMVEHARVKSVEILDWDRKVNNEKALYYQLMINAIVIAAHCYTKAHPVIQQIANATIPYVNGEGYQGGMPKLCMGKEEFAKHGFGNPDFDSPALSDLIENISTIAPHIELTEEEKNQVISILKTEFRRQYKALTRSPIPAELSVKQKEKETATNINLPFKDIKLEYMPGAKEWLDQRRNANTRLVLISYKGKNDLQNEVNKLGVAHYFDWMTGTSMETVNSGSEAKVKRLNKKSNSDLVREVLNELSLDHQDIQIRLRENQESDVI